MTARIKQHSQLATAVLSALCNMSTFHKYSVSVHLCGAFCAFVNVCVVGFDRKTKKDEKIESDKAMLAYNLIFLYREGARSWRLHTSSVRPPDIQMLSAYDGLGCRCQMWTDLIGLLTRNHEEFSRCTPLSLDNHQAASRGGLDFSCSLNFWPGE